jgi:uncharacterized protein (DUF427 family)
MRRHLEPSQDHPISVTRRDTPVSIRLAGVTVLAARNHLELREATYPPVAYIPRDQVDMSRLERPEHTSWCPYKGEAAYYHLRMPNGDLVENAIWTYETPFPAVAEIEGALAVYPNKVDAIKIGA